MKTFGLVLVGAILTLGSFTVANAAKKLIVTIENSAGEPIELVKGSANAKKRFEISPISSLAQGQTFKIKAVKAVTQNDGSLIVLMEFTYALKSDPSVWCRLLLTRVRAKKPGSPWVSGIKKIYCSKPAKFYIKGLIRSEGGRDNKAVFYKF